MNERGTGSLSAAESESVPWSWRLAGWLRRFPEFRGRDRLETWLTGRTPPPAGRHRGSFGPGLRFEVCYDEDGSLAELFLLQYEPPSLVPVLEATLGPGACMFDVGANIGVYSGWAAKLVGPAGQVHAFEPVPTTRAYLERFAALNALTALRVVPQAVGSRPGALRLHLVPRASGLTSAVPPPGRETIELDVPVTTLDAHAALAGVEPPCLIKIDVEGFELHALKGARDLLRRVDSPAVLFESESAQLRRAGTGFAEIVRWLHDEAGYDVFGLTPRGLLRSETDAAEPAALNSLALHPTRHAALLGRLGRHRFRRNQTC